MPAHPREDVSADSGAGAPAPTPTADPYAGRVFGGRYKVISKLGEGAFGAVYKGLQLNLEQDVAIKLLKPEMGANDVLVKRFYNEARIYARINSPHVVKIHDFGQDEGDPTLYLIMEYLNGIDLGQIIRGTGALPVERVLLLSRHLTQGLMAAHELGVVHRDIKPANVMVLDAETDRPFGQLLDFGISKLAEGPDEEHLPEDPLAKTFQRGLTRAGKFTGTPAYMSPEQCHGHHLNHRSDLYSMGIVMYEMLCGRPPFSADNLFKLLRMHVADVPVPPREAAPDQHIPDQVQQIVMRCLEKSPSGRFQSAEELLAELEEATHGLLAPDLIPLIEVDQQQSEEQDLPLSRRAFGSDADDKAATVAVVKRILATLSKAYKSFSLYPRDNPVVNAATHELCELMETFFEDEAELCLSVDRFAIYFDDAKVYEDLDLRNSYPFRLFTDGIRRLFFHDGIGPDEIAEYFECLRRVSRSPSLTSDLVTLMWEKQFRNITYLVIEDLVEEQIPDIDLLTAGYDVLRDDYKSKSSEDENTGEDHAKSEELIKAITEQERAELAALVEADRQDDHTSEFIRAIFRVLLWTDDPDEATALVKVLAQVSSVLLGLGDLAHEVPLLKGIHTVLDRVEDVITRAELENLILRAGDRDHVETMLVKMREDRTEEIRESVGMYLGLLGPNAVAEIVDFLDTLDPALELPVVQSALYRLSRKRPELLQAGLASERWEVVTATAEVLAKIRAPEAIELLLPLLEHEVASIREQAIVALTAAHDPHLVEHLSPLLNDIASIVRVAAMESLLTVEAGDVESVLLAVLEDPDFKDRPRAEQLTLFRILATMGSEEVVLALGRLLVTKTYKWHQRRAVQVTGVAVGSVVALLLLVWGLGNTIGLVVFCSIAVVAALAGSDWGADTEPRRLVLVEPAAFCLKRIGGPHAMQLLSNAKRSGPPKVRRICARVLRQGGPSDPSGGLGESRSRSAAWGDDGGAT